MNDLDLDQTMITRESSGLFRYSYNRSNYLSILVQLGKKSRYKRAHRYLEVSGEDFVELKQI